MIAPDNQRWREYLAEALANVKLPDNPSEERDEPLPWDGMEDGNE